MQNYHGNMFNDQDKDDKSSLEAAAEAAAKVNALLIAKGMLKPNQIHSATNVITKKAGGPNSLVVAEVEINNLTTQCRNTLTKGTTQEEISKASGAAVTTRGRYIAPNEKSRNARDRCLYLNVQAARKESVDIAVQKINEIIRSMCGNSVEQRGYSIHPYRGGKMRPPFRMNMCNSIFNLRGRPPPPLMSLPTPPPPPQPLCHQMPPLPPPGSHSVTVLQENLYIGLEHAPPNFDTKNKILGPGGSYLQHIQAETGAHVSLRGRGSGCLDLNGADSIEPMHVHVEHELLLGLQEAKKLAENLIQTVQQSYVSFQQALAALPASVPTGLITGVHQQSPFVEAQLAAPPPGLTEQSLQVMQPQVQQLGPPTMLMPAGSVASQLPQMAQAMSNAATHPAMVLPSSLSLTQMPLVSTMTVSAASMLPPQPTHLELGGQQSMILSQQPPPSAQTITQMSLQQLVHGPPPVPQPVPPPMPGPLGAYSHVQPTVQLVSQTSIAPQTLIHEQGPPLIAPPPQPGQHILAPQPGLSMSLTSIQPGAPISLSAPTSLVYTLTSSGTYITSPKLEDQSKHRFAEEKDKIPENLLGYQHGPPHLVNLMCSSPPPPPPISQGLMQHLSTQLMHPPPHSLIHVTHMPPEEGQFAHLGPHTILQTAQQIMPSPADGQQIMAAPPGHAYLPPPHQGLPPHLLGPPPPGPAHSPAQHIVTRSPNVDNRPPSSSFLPSMSAMMIPPPCLPLLAAPQLGEGKKEEDSKVLVLAKSPEAGSKHGRSSPSLPEPDKKKMKGAKNKHVSQQEQDNVAAEAAAVKKDRSEELAHFSPSYQGQPVRYPCMPSDPYLPPASQESAVPLQFRTLPSPVPSSIPPGHHFLHQLDPNLQTQVHIAHQHIHMEDSRPNGHPTQIVIEHPGSSGAPIPVHISHALEGASHQVLIQHPGRQGIHIEHPSPVHTGAPMSGTPSSTHVRYTQEHPCPAHPGAPMSCTPTHSEQLHTHITTSHPVQASVSQEIYEFDVGTQQVTQAAAQFHQTFEHITISQAKQPGEQMLPPGSAVIVSSTQHFPQYSVALSSPATPSTVTYALQTSTPFPMHTQPVTQHIQRMSDGQHISVPPPPSYSLGLQPAVTSNFQAHFAGMQPAHPQSIAGHILQQTQQPPPPLPAVSQTTYQAHSQGISYWVSQV